MLDAIRAGGRDPRLAAALSRLVEEEGAGGVAGGLYLVACAVSGIPVTAAGSPRAWLASLGAIMDECEPDLLFRIPALLPPSMHADGMLSVLSDMAARLPPAVPGDAFLHRPHMPVQLAPAADAVSERLLVCVCGRQGRLGMPVNVFHRWAAGASAHVLYLRALDDAGYDDGIPAVGAGFTVLATFVQDVAGALGVKHVGVYGSSMGAFPGLRLGLAVGARRIVSAGGIAIEVRPGSRTVPTPGERAEARNSLRRELEPALRAVAGCTEVLCLYARGHAFDRADAMILSGLPGVRSAGVPQTFHNVGRHLATTGTLGPLLAWTAGARADLDGLSIDEQDSAG